jgi:hypothetical protein
MPDQCNHGYKTFLRRETEEKAHQPETKLGAIAHTRHKARLRNGKRSQTKNPQNPRTGRKTGLNHPSQGLGKTAHRGPTRGPSRNGPQYRFDIRCPVDRANENTRAVDCLCSHHSCKTGVGTHLSKAFKATRQHVVDHPPDVTLVNAHAKCDGCDHCHNAPLVPTPLHPVAVALPKASVVASHTPIICL